MKYRGAGILAEELGALLWYSQLRSASSPTAAPETMKDHVRILVCGDGELGLLF